MGRNKSHGFETPAYRYAEVERALAVMLGADAATQRGALRARGKRLLTLGLPEGEKPGKGTRRLYSWSEVTQLAVALLLEDTGLDPVAVVPAIKFFWPHLRNWVKLATADAARENPMMLHVRLRTVTGPWEDKDPASAMPQIGISPQWDERTRAKYRELKRPEIGAYLPHLLLSRPDRGWVAFRDLTAELTKLQAALHSS